MSERRFKRNYSIDGWPVEDTQNGVVLHADDLVVILNKFNDQVTELEQQLKTAKADGVREFAEKTYPAGAIYTAAEAPFAGNAKRRALQYANNLEGK